MIKVLNGRAIGVDENSYLQVPTKWFLDSRMKPGDAERLTRLWWRYSFFVYSNLRDNPEHDIKLSFYPTQQTLCDLLGYSEASRSKVSAFLTRMENFGYITRIKTGFMKGNELVHRHYITVINNNHSFKGISDDAT